MNGLVSEKLMTFNWFLKDAEHHCWKFFGQRACYNYLWSSLGEIKTSWRKRMKSEKK